MKTGFSKLAAVLLIPQATGEYLSALFKFERTP